MQPAGAPRRQGSGKVLILGKDTRSFLAVVRSLGRRGLEVHVAWCPRGSLALRSKHVAKIHELPPPGPGEAWCDALLELIRKEDFELVFPTNDPAAVALQRERGRIEQHVPVALLNDEGYRTVFDKRATHELATSLGVPVPREVLVGEGDDARSLVEALGLPLVLKPRASFAFGRKKWEHHVRKARTHAEVDACLRVLRQHGDVLAQENVSGVGVGVELLAVDGEVVLAFQHVRVHEPLLGGGSSYRRSAALDDDLLEAARGLVRAMDYSGLAMIEFKRDEESGRWHLIEINGRCWGSMPLAVAAGCDFPWAVYRWKVHGEAGAQPEEYREGLYARNWLMDLNWLIRNARADRGDPVLATVPLRRVALEAVNVLRLRERSDTFQWRDPGPGLGELRRIAGILADVAGNKLRSLPYKLPPVRAARSAQLARRLRGSRLAVFVCKGNICRSPLAERVARELLPPGVEVRSAGYHPAAGRRCPTEAVQAAAAIGRDLGTHRSQVLTDELVREADTLWVFDPDNLRVVLHHHPEARGKTYRFGLLSPDGAVDVRDPYGGGLADYERAYGRIVRALEAALAARGTLVEEDRPLAERQ